MRALARHHERHARRAAGDDGVGEPLLGRQAPGREGEAARGRGRGQRELPLDRRDHVGAVAQRGAERAQAAERERARDDEGVGSIGEPPLLQRQPRGVDGRLGARAAAAVQPHARSGVAAVTARAVRAAREAGPHRAHEPVVVQVQDHAGARLARRLERAPAEVGVHVVRVHDARAGAADRLGDVARPQAAGQQPRGRPRPREGAGVALEHLGRLAEVRRHQPGQVLDGPLLAARDAVPVVQEQDHGRRSLTSHPGVTARLDPLPDPPPPRVPRGRAAVRRAPGPRPRRGGDRGRGRSGGSPDARPRGAPRRALPRPRVAARAQRHAQHGDRRGRRRPAVLPRRRRRGVAGLARRAARGRRPRRRARRARRPDPRAAGGRPAARMRPRAAAPDDARPRPRGPRRRVRVGREHDAAPAGARAHRAVRPAAERRGRRGGLAAAAARRGGRIRYVAAAGSTTAGRAPTPPSAG